MLFQKPEIIFSSYKEIDDEFLPLIKFIISTIPSFEIPWLKLSFFEENTIPYLYPCQLKYSNSKRESQQKINFFEKNKKLKKNILCNNINNL